MLLDAWMSDPLACCEKSGVTPPSNLFSEKPIVAESLSSPTQTDAPNPFAEVSLSYSPLNFLLKKKRKNMAAE